MEDFRGRTANDRAAALEAKYDPEDDIALRRLGTPVEAGAFLNSYDAESVIREIQKERGLKAGDRALKGSVGREVNAPERVDNYV